MSNDVISLSDYTKYKILNVITGNNETDMIDFILCYKCLDKSIYLINECKKIIAFQKDISISSCYKFIDAAFYRQLLKFTDEDMIDFLHLSKKYPKIQIAKCMNNYKLNPSSIIDNQIINLNPLLVLPTGKFNKIKSIDKVTATVIASGLTFISSDIFIRLSLSELITITYTDKYNDDESPSVNRLIKYVNKISNWVASEILNKTNIIDQVNLFKKFIDVMTFLKLNNDFCSLMAIFAGLNSNSIQRLDYIKDIESIEFDKISQFMSSQRNFKNYREYFDTILNDNSITKIPFMAVHISDIKFIHDNFKAKDLMSYNEFNSIYNDICNVINKIKNCKYRTNINNNGIDGFILYFEKYNTLNDKELYEKSYLIKPMRSSTKEMIVRNNSIESPRSFNILTKKRSSKNKKIELWTTLDVCEWLPTIGLGEYIKAFENHEINGKRLLHFLDMYQNDNFLKEDLGILKLGHRIELILGIKELQNYI